MPPKSPNKPGSVGQKMFTADTVAALLVALDNPVITRDQLNLMSALDGTRTADAFQHQMRPVVSKAKELKAKIKAGEVFLPIKSSSKKRGAGDDSETPPATPTKKVKNTPNKLKATPKPRLLVKKEEVQAEAATELALPTPTTPVFRQAAQVQVQYPAHYPAQYPIHHLVPPAGPFYPPYHPHSYDPANDVFGDVQGTQVQSGTQFSSQEDGVAFAEGFDEMRREENAWDNEGGYYA